jgi:nitrogen fixation protein FixH
MKSTIAERVFSVLSVLAMLILLVAAEVGVRSSVAQAQDKPSVTQAKAQVDLTTDPSPAQKGSNMVRVKLTDPAGKPITGAQVTVTFFMEAMPAMNMPEMKTVIKVADKGRGMYEGKGDLGSGGIWQVTVTAQQGGQTIATKKLAVKATGGA